MVKQNSIKSIEGTRRVAEDLWVSIPGIFEGKLIQYESVWAPYSAQYFLEQMAKNRIFELMAGKSGVDLGSASGLLGLAVKAQGAGFIIFLDNQPDAVRNADENASARHLKRGIDEDYMSIQSDTLDALKEMNIKVHFIMGNLPMNPKAKNVHDDNPRMQVNGNGDEWGDGNYVLLRTIRESKEVLEDDGFILVNASSRQGIAETIAELNMNYPGAWNFVNYDEQGQPGHDEELNLAYHGPFINHWISRSKDDLVEQDPNVFFRVFHKDPEGNPFLVTQGKMLEERGGKRISVSAVKTIFYRDGKKYIHVKNGSEYLMCLTDDEPIELTDEWRRKIPVAAANEPYYHRYYMIMATNRVEEEEEGGVLVHDNDQVA